MRSLAADPISGRLLNNNQNKDLRHFGQHWHGSCRTSWWFQDCWPPTKETRDETLRIGFCRPWCFGPVGHGFGDRVRQLLRTRLRPHFTRPRVLGLRSWFPARLRWSWVRNTDLWPPSISAQSCVARRSRSARRAWAGAWWSRLLPPIIRARWRPPHFDAALWPEDRALTGWPSRSER